MKIHLFNNGQYAITQTDQNTVEISGKKPEKTIEATVKNIDKFIKDKKVLDYFKKTEDL